VLRFLGFRLCGNVKPDDASSGSSSSELQAQVTRRISDDLKAWIPKNEPSATNTLRVNFLRLLNHYQHPLISLLTPLFIFVNKGRCQAWTAFCYSFIYQFFYQRHIR
jgi:hypothetical protein